MSRDPRLKGLGVGRIIHVVGVAGATEMPEGVAYDPKNNPVSVCRAAIVTRVVDREKGAVLATVHAPHDPADGPSSHCSDTMSLVTPVLPDFEDTTKLFRWHWPEKEE